jgi:hypothetical protein
MVTMQGIAGERGHAVSLVRLSMREFPANLTRIGILAKVDAGPEA